MKRILTLITVFTFLLTACEGPQGPPGFDGFDGRDGLDADEFAAQSFERTVNFQFNNQTGLQEAIEVLPFDIFDSDVVLVYRLEAEVEIDGVLTEAWAPLPQNFFLENDDIIQYIFNHTFADVELLIDGNFDLSTLDSGFTQGQRFRFVILPAIAINGINTSDINNVIEMFNIQNFPNL